jgi:multidrug efflux pump subunit AcrA (membrane-fusion protein)
MQRRLHQLIAAGAAVALVVDGFLLLRFQHRAEGRDPPPAVPVTTALVVSGDVPIEQDALGQVTAINTVTIRPRGGGPDHGNRVQSSR